MGATSILSSDRQAQSTSTTTTHDPVGQATALISSVGDLAAGVGGAMTGGVFGHFANLLFPSQAEG